MDYTNLLFLYYSVVLAFYFLIALSTLLLPYGL
jgi:hypothetical protein